jgi:hypothetical protein
VLTSESVATLLLGKFLVQKPINQHAGHGHVHPQWPGPSGNSFVLIESRLQGLIQRDENHRHNGHGQDGVRGQKGQVNRSEPGRLFEAGEVVKENVVSQIAGQKQRR